VVIIGAAPFEIAITAVVLISAIANETWCGGIDAGFNATAGSAHVPYRVDTTGGVEASGRYVFESKN